MANRNTDPLWDMIPNLEIERILSQDMCELDAEFLGFTNEYIALAQIIPKHFTVIDFGCYLAAQCYCFSEHSKYIGVDIVQMERFSTRNTVHFVTSIQQFIREYGDAYPVDTTFAICSYVPDFGAAEMVRRKFKNLFVFYPAGTESELIRRMPSTRTG